MKSFHLYWRSMRYFSQHRGGIFLLIFSSLLATVFSLALAWPLALLIDLVIEPGKTELSWVHHSFLRLVPQNTALQIILLTLCLFFLKLGSELIRAFQTLIRNKVNHDSIGELRCDLFKKLQALHLPWHQKRSDGDKLYRLHTDTNSLSQLLSVSTDTLIAGFTFIFMFFVLAERHFGLTLLVFLVVPPLYIANVIYEKRLSEASRKAKESESEFVVQAQRSMRNMPVIQAFAREDCEVNRFEANISSSIRAWWNVHREELYYWLIIGTVFSSVGSLIFGVGASLVSARQFSLGDLTIFLAYLGALWDPICKLTGAKASMAGALVGLSRVFEILSADEEIKEASKPQAIPHGGRAAISLENISFHYASGKNVLNELNLHIQFGEFVALVGQSGEGKSTLLNLFPRFHDPSTGVVRIGGIDIREFSLRELRRSMAVVLQESLLLPTTIAENIAYGRPVADASQVVNAAVLSGAHEFIMNLPEAYQTRLEENASNLSGGQRQRIAIARALLTEAPILIFDEPTSAVDAGQERSIMETIRSLKAKRTIIMITHNEDNLAYCDSVYRLESGRLHLESKSSLDRNDESMAPDLLPGLNLYQC